MENQHFELRIVTGRRKNLLILKIAAIILVLALLVALVIWKLIDNDSGLVTLDALERQSMIQNVLIESIWNRIIWFIVCAVPLILLLVLLESRQVKLVKQMIIENFRNIYKRKRLWRQAFSLGFKLFSMLVICVILIGASQASLSIVQHSLHLRSSEDTTLYIPDKRFIPSHKNSSPITANVTRYNTEDVLMRCQFYVVSKTDVTASVILQSLHWTKDNGSRITETDKVHINTTVKKNLTCKINHEFLIRSVLTIELIDDGDYGTYYSCKYSMNLNEAWLKPDTELYEMFSLFVDLEHPYFDAYEPPEIQREKLEVMNLTEMTKSVFHLEKQEMPVKTARVSPGGLFIDHVPYWSLADPGDITFNTTISGKDNADCCWLPARLYKYFFGYDNLVWRGKIENQHQRYLIRQQCVCIEDLVLNNFTVAFVRTRYNSTTKRQEKFEVGHPRQVILIPEIPIMFGFYPLMGESLWLRNDYQNCAITNDSSIVCQGRFGYMNNLFNLMMGVDAFSWVFNFTLTIIPLVMCWFVIRGWIRHFLLPVQKVILDPPPMTEDYAYDLYLMYDEEDSYEKKLAKTLRESVERRTFSVFEPRRDMIPGHIALTEKQRAIEQSRTFLVIFSSSTENDDEQNLELVAIKNTLAARTDLHSYTTDNIFTVKLGNCNVDSLLSSSVKTNVPENDRETNALDEDVLHTFLDWTKASEVAWIKMQRDGVEGACQRLQPHVHSMFKYGVFIGSYLILFFYFLPVFVLSLQYRVINAIRHSYFEAE